MNILVVANGIPKTKGQINGIFAFDQAKALSKSGQNVILAVIDTRSIRHRRKYGFSKYIKDNIQVYEYSIPVGRVPVDILLHMIAVGFNNVYKHIIKEEIHIDIVHTHFYEMTYAAAKLKSKYGYKLVATEHYSAFVNPNYKDKKELIVRAARAYQSVDCLIAVSGALATVLERECAKKAVVIHNILDADSFVANHPNHNHDGIRFIAIGRLTAQKNYPLLIRAFAEAHKENEKLHLDIYGDGELREELSDLIEFEKAEQYIVLRGAVDRSHLSKEMQNAEAFILLSDFETFGVVYIEAIASGLPVIATRCGGPNDFVSSKNGILVDCGDTREAIEAIEYMARNYSKYDPEKISTEIKRDFSPNTIAKKIISEYEKINSNK